MAENEQREPIVKIDGKSYKLADLSEQTKKIIASVRMTDEETERLERSLTIARAARVAYTQALIAAVRDVTPVDGAEANPQLNINLQ